MTVLFLGSNIGNMSAETSVQFLHDVHTELRTGDRLLLGTDLLKPELPAVLSYSILHIAQTANKATDLGLQSFVHHQTHLREYVL